MAAIGGHDQGVAPTLAAGLAHEDPGHQIDRVGEDGPEDQEPQIHLGIPEDPPEEEDRPGDVPQDHRSVSNPIEGGVGEGVGDGILFPRDVFEPVRESWTGASWPPDRAACKAGVLDPVSPSSCRIRTGCRPAPSGGPG